MKARFPSTTTFSWLAWLLAVGVFAIWTLLARDWLGVWLAQRSYRKDLPGLTNEGRLKDGR